MAVNTFLGGGGNFLSPLISFYTFLDLDTGLFNLIEEEYFDEETFNPEFYTLSNIDKIYNIYYRNCDNPLEVIGLNPEEDKEKLEEYYKQFIEQEMDKILELSYTTEMYDFLEMSLDTVEVRPTILCYTKEQEERFALFDEFHNIPVINIKDVVPDDYTQFYVRYIWELDPFIDLECKTFYICACGPNMDEELRDFKPFEQFKKIIENRSDVCAFSIYDKNIIGAPETYMVDPRNKQFENNKEEEEESESGTDNDENS